MQVDRFAEGLWRWATDYEDWGAEVGCVYYEASDAIVLIDPLVPNAGPEATRFWEALDRDVQRAASPVHVLITVFWHARSAGEIARRYDGRLHAPTRARATIERRTGFVSDVFRPGDTLPGGIQAYASGRATEVVYWIPAHRTLVPGDVILGSDSGGLVLCPQSWLPSGLNRSRLATALEPLLELPIERVLVSHGEPVTANASAVLAQALAAARV